MHNKPGRRVLHGAVRRVPIRTMRPLTQGSTHAAIGHNMKPLNAYILMRRERTHVHTTAAGYSWP